MLYLPAAKAGMVTDFTGWLNEVRNAGFAGYVNRTHFSAHSLYQFTQIITYLFYKLFGVNPWLWHLLFITLHVANATLLFTICGDLLTYAGAPGNEPALLGGLCWFCISPYISEVIVWEPAFHFLSGLLMLLGVLRYTQLYLHTGRARYAWFAGIVYFLSTYSLEVFYITPWLVCALGLFYHCAGPANGDATGLRAGLRRVIICVAGPMFALFALRLVVYRMAYGGWVSRIGTNAVTSVSWHDLGKPAKYLYHLIFLGRFSDDATRQAVYAFLDSPKGLCLFYGMAAIILFFIIVRFRKMTGKGKVISLLAVCTAVTLALLIPLWFQDMLLVIFDRYTYFTGAFLYVLLALMVSCARAAHVRLGLAALFTLANLRFAVMVNRYWSKSAKIIAHLLHNLPDPGNRVLVLLNLPECLNGVPMIGSEPESEYKLMHNLLVPEQPIKSKTYDGLSYNMLTPHDGAHAEVINDSTVRVTLNQWGTWWWYGGLGGNSYQNADYRLNMIDGGHFYEIVLRKPRSGYLLLYNVGDEWKEVK